MVGAIERRIWNEFIHGCDARWVGVVGVGVTVGVAGDPARSKRVETRGV